MQLTDLPGPVLAHGDDLPRFTPVRIFTELEPLSLVALLIVASAVVYGYGAYRLRQRGDRWPATRTVAFLVGGLGTIAAVTVSGIGAYDDTLLSVHMVQHMVLSMVSPIFLALGAPITLALRTLRRRPRHALLAALHSRVFRVVSFPLVAYGIFIANPFILYFTGLYRFAVEHTWAHELLHVHFIVTGCLFFWPLIGLDPLPNKWPYPARSLLMLLSVPFHTVLGLTVMYDRTLVGGDYYPSLHLTWANPWDDQFLAGGILWAGGELVSVTLLVVLLRQWIKESEREAKRIDRALDRAEAEAEARARKDAEAEARVRAGAATIADPAVRPQPHPE